MTFLCSFFRIHFAWSVFTCGRGKNGKVTKSKWHLPILKERLNWQFSKRSQLIKRHAEGTYKKDVRMEQVEENDGLILVWGIRGKNLQETKLVGNQKVHTQDWEDSKMPALGSFVSILPFVKKASITSTFPMSHSQVESYRTYLLSVREKKEA